MATPVHKSFCVLQFAATAIPKAGKSSGTQKFPHGNETYMLAALAQMVACLPPVRQVRGSIPGGVVNFQHKPGLNSKPFRNMYVEKAYSTVDSDSSVGWGR